MLTLHECRRILLSLDLWLHRRRVHRRCPDIAHGYQTIRTRRKRHGRTANAISRQCAAMTERLRREIGMTGRTT
jgi:hypothetical protein